MFYEGRGALQEGSKARVTDRHSTDHNTPEDAFRPAHQSRELLDFPLGVVCFYKATFQSILKLCILVIHLFWTRVIRPHLRMKTCFGFSNVFSHRINTFPIMNYDTVWSVDPLGRTAFSAQRTFNRAEAAFTLAQKKLIFCSHLTQIGTWCTCVNTKICTKSDFWILIRCVSDIWTSGLHLIPLRTPNARAMRLPKNIQCRRAVYALILYWGGTLCVETAQYSGAGVREFDKYYSFATKPYYISLQWDDNWAGGFLFVFFKFQKIGSSQKIVSLAV